MNDNGMRKYPSVQQVSDQERIGMVKDIFSTITARYDFLNHFLSLRRDIAWRRFAVRRMAFGTTMRFLDVATGTADLAIDAARRHPAIAVTGIDFVKEMLDLGKVKIHRKGLSGQITLLQADALALPFPDNTFDVAGIAFGIRNIPDRMGALKEMARVVVPGGQIMVLEMTFTRNWFSNLVYQTYLNRILPSISARFSRNPGAYHYLADSIMNFPPAEQFARMMGEAGMTQVVKHKLTFGATFLYEGIKC